MANKKVSQLVSKPSVLVTDLFPIADPTTGQLFKTTISDLGTAIGSGVSSVNTLVGAVVLDTDDIQELASPTNRWFTDTRARAAISGGTGISYNSGTGVIINAVTSGQIATALGYTPANGANYLALAGGTMGGAITGTIATFASSTSVTALGITLSGASGDGVKINHSAGRAFNIQSSGSGFGILINNETASTSAPFTIQKQGLAVITLTDVGAGSFASSLTASSFIRSSGTSAQFLKADGSVDSSTYLTTGTAASTYLPLAGGTLTGNLNGTNITITNSLIAKGGTFNGGASAAGIVTIDGLSSNVLMNRTDTNNGTLISFLTNAVEMWHIGMRSGGTDNFVIYNSNLLANAVSVNISNSAVTLAGALNGTSAIFSSSVRSSGYYLTGMTLGSGALYYNSGANRVTVANYNASGIVTFEVNGGNTALTLNSNLSATFASTLSATGATLTGALSGTSATFSGAVVATSITNNGIYYGKANASYPSTSLGYFALKTNNLDAERGGLTVQVSNSTSTFIDALTLNYTGAATFSSSVTATQGQFFSGNATSTQISLGNGNVFFYNIGRSSADGYLNFSGNQSGFTGYIFGGADGERMRIATNGNVGIGTTAPTAKLHLKASSSSDQVLRFEQQNDITSQYYFNIDSATNGALSLVTNYLGGNVVGFSQSRAGNVGIGTTSPGRKFVVEAAPGTFNEVGSFTNLANNASGDFAIVTRLGANAANTNSYHYIAVTGTADRFYVYGNGNVVNTNGSYGTLSDSRLKENISDATPKLADLLAVKVKNFNLIGEETKQIGVIAQELEEIFPSMVETDGKTGMKQVKTSIFIPMLIKAVQELKAELDTLKNK